VTALLTRLSAQIAQLQQKIDEKTRELECLAAFEDRSRIVLDTARNNTKQCRDELMELHRQNIAAERAERGPQ
jgi:hypothetical protein